MANSTRGSRRCAVTLAERESTPGVTRLLALLGQPVAHSRSPAMMSAALHAMGVDAVYVPREVSPAHLEEAVRGLRVLGFTGGNVTLPHKVKALAMMDHLDPLARAVGAVNTIVRHEATLVGYNTDAAGVVAALREAQCEPRGAHTVVIGTGGAARAATAGLAGAGARSVTVLGRRGGVALAVAAVAREVAADCEAWGLAMPSPEASAAMQKAMLVVQATPCGMDGGPPATVVLAAADLREAPPGAVALDLVYVPARTAWIAAAESAGMHTVGGAGVLVHQGAEALRLWFGIEPPLAVMRAAIERAGR